MPRYCLRRGHPSHLPEQVLNDSGIAASLVIAAALPRSFRIAVQLFVVEPLEHRSGEKRIPLFGNQTTGIDKPKIEIVSRENGAMARFCGRIDIDYSPA